MPSCKSTQETVSMVQRHCSFYIFCPYFLQILFLFPRLPVSWRYEELRMDWLGPHLETVRVGLEKCVVQIFVSIFTHISIFLWVIFCLCAECMRVFYT